MNLSGVSIKPLMERNEVAPADLILIYDELNLPWGSLRVRPKGSAAGHNGVIDVIDKIGRRSSRASGWECIPAILCQVERIICCRVLTGSKPKPGSVHRPRGRCNGIHHR